MRPAGEIGEQRLHVARAHLAAVHAVDAALPALDPAADLELGLLMEGRRGGARRLLQAQRHLGDVARGAGRGAGEDDVLHLAAAQGFRALFSPIAQRSASTTFDLPQPFGPTIPVRPGRISTRRGLGEALEPGDAEAGEADGQGGSS